MALTRITKGVIKPNENYDTHNINSTGIVTAIGLDINGNGDISGNLSVGGVVTYEDVTSIDSVGIITAQKDIHVGAGVSIVGIVTAATGDFFDLDVDGHTNLDHVSVAGVTTFANKVTAAYGPNKGIQVGSNLKLTDQVNVFIQNTANSSMYLMSKGTAIRDRSNNNIATFSETAGSSLFHHSGSTKKLGTSATGIEIPEDLDVDGHTELDNVNIVGVTTHNGTTNLYGNGGASVVWGDTGYSGHLSFDGSDNAVIRAASGKALIFQTNHVNERLRIDSTGHTTIKSGAHDKGLDLLATANSRETRFRIQGKASDGTEHNFTFAAKASSNHLHMSGTGPMCFIGSQNVGVQNAAPDSPLQIGGGTNPHTTKATVHIAPSSGNASLCLRGGNPTIYFDKTGSPANAKILLDNVPLALYSGNIDSEGSELLRITSTGHVVPGADSAYDLGLTGTRFRNLYADTLYGDGSNLTGIVGVPSGCIILWSGAANAIPSGFVLCNGSNSTPDLRGKFVVGYHNSNGDYDVGDTGGAETVTLSEAQMPSHNHTFSSSHTHGSGSYTTNTTGNHSHTWQRQDVGINNGYRPWPASNNDCKSTNVSTSNAGNHSHSISGTSGSGTASGTTGNKGSGNAHENRPPYYALCYIMKT